MRPIQNKMLALLTISCLLITYQHKKRQEVVLIYPIQLQQLIVKMFMILIGRPIIPKENYSLG